MPYLDLPGVRLFHTDEASEGVAAPGRLGTPTVLVHGWLGTSDTWIHQLPALRARCRTVTVDLRGHGCSDAPDSRYDAAEFTGDLAAALLRLGLGPAVVVGHSMGASLASLLAVEHPELVAALVLVDPDYAGAAAERDRLRAVADLGDEDAVADGVAEMIARGVDAATQPAHLRAWHQREIARMRPFVVAHSLRANLDGPLRFRPAADALLARRPQPVLAFHRNRDRAAVERAVRAHPASAVVDVDGCGHWIHQERPGLVERELEAWLAALPSPRR